LLEREEKEIEMLIDKALYSVDLSESNKAINTLTSFREKALPSLHEIVESSTDSGIRKYALEAIRKIKEGSV
jgi:hypothetical protein